MMGMNSLRACVQQVDSPLRLIAPHFLCSRVDYQDTHIDTSISPYFIHRTLRPELVRSNFLTTKLIQPHNATKRAASENSKEIVYIFKTEQVHITLWAFI